MGAFGRNGPVVSIESGGVGLACGIKRRILDVATTRCEGSDRRADVHVLRLANRRMASTVCFCRVTCPADRSEMKAIVASRSEDFFPSIEGLDVGGSEVEPFVVCPSVGEATIPVVLDSKRIVSIDSVNQRLFGGRRFQQSPTC